jgi:hypothetical protein
MSSVTDLEIYQRLSAVAEELERLSERGPSLVGGAALSTASRTLRGMASAIYEHSLGAAEEESKLQ